MQKKQEDARPCAMCASPVMAYSMLVCHGYIKIYATAQSQRYMKTI